jgi:hypothetical protein
LHHAPTGYAPWEECPLDRKLSRDLDPIGQEAEWGLDPVRTRSCVGPRPGTDKKLREAYTRYEQEAVWGLEPLRTLKIAGGN